MAPGTCSPQAAGFGFLRFYALLPAPEAGQEESNRKPRGVHARFDLLQVFCFAPTFFFWSEGHSRDKLFFWGTLEMEGAERFGVSGSTCFLFFPKSPEAKFGFPLSVHSEGQVARMGPVGGLGSTASEVLFGAEMWRSLWCMLVG